MKPITYRENYTSDSNAMVVHLLRQLASYYDLLQIDRAFSNQLLQLSVTIAEAINNRLFDEDHLITQLNADGTIRDFVDYDSNLIAIAFGQYYHICLLSRLLLSPVLLSMNLIDPSHVCFLNSYRSDLRQG